MNKKTTDNLNEVFDVVDKNDRVVGQASRGRCHQNKKLIHRAIHLLVFNDKGKIYFQKRSQTKDMYPGAWTDAVAGHVASGSNYWQTALREAREEIGVDFKRKELAWVDKTLVEMESETEIVVLFIASHNGPFVLNQDEIEKGAWFKLEEFISAIKLGKIQATPVIRYLFINNPNNVLGKIKAALPSF